MAPPKPNKTPKTLIRVSFSDKNTADNNNTIIGAVIIITEALIGVVYSKPLKKVSIFRAIPKKEAKTKVLKSLRSIFSFLVNKLNNQNYAVAPIIRTIINPKGLIKPWEIIPFAKVKVSPYSN